MTQPVGTAVIGRRRMYGPIADDIFKKTNVVVIQHQHAAVKVLGIQHGFRQFFSGQDRIGFRCQTERDSDPEFYRLLQRHAAVPAQKRRDPVKQ